MFKQVVELGEWGLYNYEDAWVVKEVIDVKYDNVLVVLFKFLKSNDFKKFIQGSNPSGRDYKCIGML